jgi:hypothetical protein
MRGRTMLILMSLLILAVLAPGAALAVLAPGAAVAKPGGTDRPWKAKASGTTTVNILTTPFQATNQGTARVSHLGRSTFSSTYTVTLAGGNTFTIAGNQTLEAANGDMLFLTFTGTGTFSGTFGVDQTTETSVVFTVTSGTGRFADASGSLTGTVFTETLSGATATQTSTLRGRISY